MCAFAAERNVCLTLPAEGYLNVLKSDAYAKIFVSARVTETKQFFLMEKTLQVNKPDLELQVRACVRACASVHQSENRVVMYLLSFFRLIFEQQLLSCRLRVRCVSAGKTLGGSR